MKDLVEKTLRFKLVNNLIPVELVQFWILGDCASESVEEFVLLEVLLDRALDLLHLHICDVVGSSLLPAASHWPRAAHSC